MSVKHGSCSNIIAQKTKAMARLALEPDQSLVLWSNKRRVTTCLQVFPKTIKICSKSNEKFKMDKKTISSLT